MDKMKLTCCICGKEIDGYGNSPWPLCTGPAAVCCDKCNQNSVIPARLSMVEENKEK